MDLIGKIINLFFFAIAMYIGISASFNEDYLTVCYSSVFVIMWGIWEVMRKFTYKKRLPQKESVVLYWLVYFAFMYVLLILAIIRHFV